MAAQPLDAYVSSGMTSFSWKGLCPRLRHPGLVNLPRARSRGQRAPSRCRLPGGFARRCALPCFGSDLSVTWMEERLCGHNRVTVEVTYESEPPETMGNHGTATTARTLRWLRGQTVWTVATPRDARAWTCRPRPATEGGTSK